MIPEQGNFVDEKLMHELRQFAYPWRALCIGIDGRLGAGKSTLGRYLSWQLGMPVLETDLWISNQDPPFRYKYRQLRDIIQKRYKKQRPIIIEGICLLSILDELNIECDYLIWASHPDGEYIDDDPEIPSDPLTTAVNFYTSDRNPKCKANYIYARTQSIE